MLVYQKLRQEYQAHLKFIVIILLLAIELKTTPMIIRPAIYIDGRILALSVLCIATPPVGKLFFIIQSRYGNVLYNKVSKHSQLVSCYIYTNLIENLKHYPGCLVPKLISCAGSKPKQQ